MDQRRLGLQQSCVDEGAVGPGQSATPSLIHESVQGKLLVVLASRQNCGNRLAAALDAQMQFDRKPALAALQRFVLTLDRTVTS